MAWLDLTCLVLRRPGALSLQGLQRHCGSYTFFLSSPTRSLIHRHPPARPPTPTHSLTRSPTHPPTHPPADSPTHPRTHPPTHPLSSRSTVIAARTQTSSMRNSGGSRRRAPRHKPLAISCARSLAGCASNPRLASPSPRREWKPSTSSRPRSVKY